jgi:hypothetical protein
LRQNLFCRPCGQNGKVFRLATALRRIFSRAGHEWSFSKAMAGKIFPSPRLVFLVTPRGKDIFRL